MRLDEIFKINMDLVPYSQDMVTTHISNYKVSHWDVFYRTDDVIIIESKPDILGRIYYIPFVKSLSPTIDKFKDIVGDNMEPSGYVEFHRQRILMASDSKKTYECKTEVYTPHIRLSDKLRGIGIAKILYAHYIDHGKSLVTNNHTSAAASLWEKLGYITFKLPIKSQTKLQACEIDDPSTVFKCIFGKGRTLDKL
jgi:hypothetical protein